MLSPHTDPRHLCRRSWVRSRPEKSRGGGRGEQRKICSKYILFNFNTMWAVIEERGTHTHYWSLSCLNLAARFKIEGGLTLETPFLGNFSKGGNKQKLIIKKKQPLAVPK